MRKRSKLEWLYVMRRQNQYSASSWKKSHVGKDIIVGSGAGQCDVIACQRGESSSSQGTGNYLYMCS
jgi:hypothetical protein